MSAFAKATALDMRAWAKKGHSMNLQVLKEKGARMGI